MRTPTAVCGLLGPAAQEGDGQATSLSAESAGGAVNRQGFTVSPLLALMIALGVKKGPEPGKRELKIPSILKSIGIF